MAFTKYHRLKNLSPIGQWLVEYTDELDTSLTELARQANLAPGTLRYLVIEPSRKPSLETCAKLAEATGIPLQEVLKIGGLSQKNLAYEPQRERLLALYDKLPTNMREILVNFAEILAEANTKMAGAIKVEKG